MLAHKQVRDRARMTMSFLLKPYQNQQSLYGFAYRTVQLYLLRQWLGSRALEGAQRRRSKEPVKT